MVKVRTSKETQQIFSYIKDLIQVLQEEFPGDTYSHWIGITSEDEGFVPCLFFYVQETGTHLKTVLHDHEAMRDINLLVKEARAKTNEYLDKKRQYEEAQKASAAGGQE